jgi:hypothetical protein
MSGRKQGRRGAGAALLAAAAGVAAAGAGLTAARRRGRGGAGGRGGDAGDETVGIDEIWTCTCGTRFRIAGAGRHMVLWPADAPQDEPVLGDRCPSCDAALPGGGDVASAGNATGGAQQS